MPAARGLPNATTALPPGAVAGHGRRHAAGDECDGLHLRRQPEPVCTHGFAVAVAVAVVAVAVDAATATPLWARRDGDQGRTPPTVTAVWPGRVYGRGAGGPVVPDTRTGADMPTKPEAAPLLVNEYAGFVLDDNRLFSYPAGG